MPFANLQSVVASDINNCWRGVYKDNTNHATSGTGEDDLASTTLTGNTLGSTGSLRILAAGTISGTNDQKDIDLYFGATVIATIVRNAAGTQDWIFDAIITNTATNAQRIQLLKSTDSATTVSADYTTAAIDTTANVTVKVTGECVNAGDAVTQTRFEIYTVAIA